MSTITKCKVCDGWVFSFMRYKDEDSFDGWKYDAERDRKASSCKCIEEL